MIGDRISERLVALDMSQSELARQVGMKPQGIQMIVAGKVERPKKLREIAKALKTTDGFLIGETDDPELAVALLAPLQAPIVGDVGAGGQAHYEIGQPSYEMTPAPDDSTPETVAVRIRGTSLGKKYNGWLAFYDERRAPVTRDMLGELCVVWLKDERVLIKWVIRGDTPGRYHLESGGDEETIYNAEVVSAALVKAITPRR